MKNKVYQIANNVLKIVRNVKIQKYVKNVYLVKI